MRARLLPAIACGCAIAVASWVRAARVADVLEIEREALDGYGETTITGVVTFAMNWIDGARIVSDPDWVDGPAAFLTAAEEKVELRRRINELVHGDLVEFRARPKAFQLEPGWEVSDFRRLGAVALPEPPSRMLPEIKSGLCNNLRTRVSGVATSASVTTADDSPLSLVRLSAEGGPVTVRWHGVLPELERFRDAELTVDCIVMPIYNPRGEFRSVELEALSQSSVKVVKPAPRDPFAVRECVAPGVLAWVPGKRDLHACKVRGVTTFVSMREGYFVIQRQCNAIRAFASGNWFPPLGATVEAAGFPEVRGDSGVLANVVWREVSPAEDPVAPLRFLASGSDTPEIGWDAAKSDIDSRLVEVEGRVVGLDLSHGERRRLMLSVGSKTVDVVLPEDVGGAEISRLRDFPRLRVTGIVSTRLTRSRVVGQYFAFDGFTVLARNAGDLSVLPDALWYARRLARYALYSLFAVLPLMTLAIIVMVVRRRLELRRREAVAADRKRIAGELHDTIAQHISGAKLWIYAAKTAAGDNLPLPAADALAMATDVLESTRVEIRHAIMDLQSDEFLNDSPAEMLYRFARSSDIPGRVRVRALLRGLPEHMPIGEKRDVLSIVQEAVSNAIRHGEAKNVIIISRGDGDAFELSVLNDGMGFDPEGVPGTRNGHFGLANMRERAARNLFAIEFGCFRGYQGVRIERRSR